MWATEPVNQDKVTVASSPTRDPVNNATGKAADQQTAADDQGPNSGRSRNAKRCSQSKPSVQSNCKRDQKEGDQPGNHLLIVSAHRKASSRLRPMVVINRGQTATARSGHSATPERRAHHIPVEMRHTPPRQADRPGLNSKSHCSR